MHRLLLLLLVAAPASAEAGRLRTAVKGAVAGATALVAIGAPQPPATARPADDGQIWRPPESSALAVDRPRPSFKQAVRSERAIAPGADPSILTIARGPSAGHYLVTTGNRRVRFSTDLVHWKVAGNLFPGGGLPQDVKGDFWAPTLSTDGKRFFLRYTGRGPAGVLRVRSAVADQVTGPYRDLGPTVPHVPGTVGEIDPDEFIDTDGSRWLLWKKDGNAVYAPTPMYIQRLGPAGERLKGKPHFIADNDQAWEGHVTEAPTAFRRGDHVYVAYAGGNYGSSGYNVGMLRIHAPDGLRAAIQRGARWQKHDGPVADATSARHVGMGHGDFVLDGSYFVSHGWKAGEVQASPRETIAREVVWSRGWPRIVNAR